MRKTTPISKYRDSRRLYTVSRTFLLAPFFPPVAENRVTAVAPEEHRKDASARLQEGEVVEKRRLEEVQIGMVDISAIIY
jgi:hypothetical protein